jgi:hypothetical protein
LKIPDFNQAIKPLNVKLGNLGYIKFLLYAKNINRGRFNFVRIKKIWQVKSFGSAINYYTMLEMKRHGYPCAECSWIDEENITP